MHFTQREDAIHAMNALNGKVCSPVILAATPHHCNIVITFFFIQVVDGSPIEVTLAKPVDKDSYVRYTRGTGGRGGSLQTDYTAYSVGQVQHGFNALRHQCQQVTPTEDSASSSSRCTTPQRRILVRPCFMPHRRMQPCQVSSAFPWRKRTLEVGV